MSVVLSLSHSASDASGEINLAYTPDKGPSDGLDQDSGKSPGQGTPPTVSPFSGNSGGGAGDRQGNDADPGKLYCVPTASSGAASVAASESHEGEADGDEKEAADGGWGWMVALGAALIMMLINVLGPCFSIIFSRFLLEMGTSSTTVGLIFNSFQFLWNFSGPILGPLLEEFSWRKVALTCSLGVSASLLLSAFATSSGFLLFSYSIIGGISCGLLSNLCFLIIPHYFVKRRGIANAIMMAGVSTGPILAPLLVRFLQEEYDYTGATLITSAVVLHCCVGAVLFRPIRTGSRKPLAEQSKTHVWRLLLRVIRGTFTNLHILKSPRAAIIAVSGAFTLNSWLNFIALMPFAVQAAGYSLQDAALCVTTSAVCNLVARLIVSVLSDWPKFSMRACYMASTATIAATTAAFSMIHDIKWLTVVMGVWGFGVGSYMGIYNLIMVHYMGLEKLTSTIGATFMLVGIGFVTVGPAIGLIRDLSESYSASMLVLAGMAAVAFVLWVLMPAAARFDRRKEQRQRNKSP